MGFKLFKYQESAVQFGLENKRALYWAARGSGKTLIAITLMQRIGALPVLVITPSSVKRQFASEIDKFTGNKYRIQILESTNKIDEEADIIIVNPDILKKNRFQLRDYGFQMAFFDESQMLKSYKSQRTKAALFISKKIPYKYCLTGSAIPNTPADLFTQLQILKPEVFGNKSKEFPNRIMNWYDFAVRYSGGKKSFYGHFEHKTATNTEELRERTKNIIYRITHEEALKEVPKVNLIDWQVQLKKKPQKEIDKMNRDFESWLREQGLTEYDIYKKMTSEALVKMNEMRKLVSVNKADIVVDMAKDINEKVIIFTWYRDTLSHVKDKLGKGAVCIQGGMNSKQKQEAIDQFRDKAQYMVINIASGGTGLNLQFANNIIFADLPWNYSDLDQAIGRCHRHGQKNFINVYKLICENSIDEKIDKYLLKKKEFEKII